MFWINHHLNRGYTAYCQCITLWNDTIYPILILKHRFQKQFLAIFSNIVEFRYFCA